MGGESAQLTFFFSLHFVVSFFFFFSHILAACGTCEAWSVQAMLVAAARAEIAIAAIAESKTRDERSLTTQKTDP